MKKLLSGILTAVLFTSLFATTAFAEGQSEYVDSTRNSFEGQTSIDYHAYSSYYVTIPTNISEYDSYGDVSVTMDNIESGYHVSVYITNLDDSGFLKVTSDRGDTGKLSVLYDNGLYTADSSGLIGEFYPEKYNYSGTASTNISFDRAMAETFKAGMYHGIVCFRVECIPDAN